MDTQTTAYIANPKQEERIKKLQSELHLESAGEVIAMALTLLEMSLGREIEFKDEKHSYKTSKFANFNQTIIIDNDGNDK